MDFQAWSHYLFLVSRVRLRPHGTHGASITSTMPSACGVPHCPNRCLTAAMIKFKNIQFHRLPGEEPGKRCIWVWSRARARAGRKRVLFAAGYPPTPRRRVRIGNNPHRLTKIEHTARWTSLRLSRQAAMFFAIYVYTRFRYQSHSTDNCKTGNSDTALLRH